MTRHVVFSSMFALAVVSASCAPNAPPSAASPLPSSMPASSPRAGQPMETADQKPAPLAVAIKLISIEVPVGAVSDSEEIWSYTDEEPAQRSIVAGLGKNGFRVGIAKQSNWPELARILRRLTGREIQETTLLTLPSVPFPIVLREHLDEQTIFTFDDTNAAHGNDYPPGDNILTMLCSLNEDEPNQVMLSGKPQVRSTQQMPFIVPSAGMLIQGRSRMFDFGRLAFRVPVEENELVLLGPGVESRRPSSVARHFLVKNKDGMEFETLLLLIPKVVRPTVKSTTAAGTEAASPS